MNDDVVIGKFGRPHGVKGEVRFFLYNPDSELLQPDLELSLQGSSVATVTVATVRRADKFAILTLVGFQGREAAERVRNAEASVPRATLPEPDPDEFYLVDAVGFELLAAKTAGAEPTTLGTLKGWLDIGPTDIMAVTGPDIRGRMLIPYADHTVDRIDFDEGRIYLHPLDTWAPGDE